MGQRLAPAQRPLALRCDLCQREVLMRLERIAEKVARLCRQRRAFTAGKPSERVVHRTLKNDIHARVLRWHRPVECTTSDAPPPAGRAQGPLPLRGILVA